MRGGDQPLVVDWKAAEAAAPTPLNIIICDWGDNKDFPCNFLGRLAALVYPGDSYACASVTEAIQEVMTRLGKDEKIAGAKEGTGKVKEIQFWGHGHPGAMSVGSGACACGQAKPGTELTIDSFTNPNDPTYKEMEKLRALLTDDAVIFFAGCSTFAEGQGRAFAEAAAKFFSENGKKPGRTVKGYNAMIGYNLLYPGEQSLKTNGEKATWPDRDPACPTITKPRQEELKRQSYPYSLPPGWPN